MNVETAEIGNVVTSEINISFKHTRNRGYSVTTVIKNIIL